MHLLGAKRQEIGQHSAENPKVGFLSYFETFSPPNAKRSTKRTFPEVSLVSITLRERTLF